MSKPSVLDITPLSPTLGARIDGLDLIQPLSGGC